MYKFVLAATIALCPAVALADAFDSGWKTVDAPDLIDLSISGAGVRVNNLTITKARPSRLDGLGNYYFTSSVTKQVAEPRDVKITIIGFKEDKTTTIMSGVFRSIDDPQENRVLCLQIEFTAFPADVAATTTYHVRVLVP